ncbi:hypothetical protein CFN78_04340 [Amycolatopsis antarctica]|uniref:Exo-alpha-sialidase n=1 Tax=Amycolatopsis antarctica TaxID=1854586 RepID=A0A263DA52_9PSEU|nr:sialidase family protein [Amycolatopsis antarctica]OZM74366.1 hypothetical protein CFN78_04340 [Amycolatopsis antarctica]
MITGVLLGALALLGQGLSPAAAEAPGPAADADAGGGAMATGTPLRNGNGLYPRLIRLQNSGEANGNLVASVVDFDPNGGVGAIYRSTDNGASFTEIGSIHDPGTPAGYCCSTLFELPRQVGAMPAGTLLWTASVGQDAPDRRMTLPIWQSPDQGVTWKYLSTCRTAENTGGIWEPELAVNNQGDLICHYADETDPAHSQQLRESFSADGLTWSAPFPTVAPPNGDLRPGMANVRQLGDGSYYMSYEICATGNQYDCATHFRTSADGADWGPPSDEGPRIFSDTGQYYTHAQTLARIDNGTGPTRLAMVGQQLRDGNGEIAAGSGNTVMINDNGGAGPWRSIPAPVSVPSPPNAPCPNYSSTLASTADGATLVEIATDLDGPLCKPYFASVPLG